VNNWEIAGLRPVKVGDRWFIFKARHRIDAPENLARAFESETRAWGALIHASIRDLRIANGGAQ
jgi:hypothetical protein